MAFGVIHIQGSFLPEVSGKWLIDLAGLSSICFLSMGILFFIGALMAKRLKTLKKRRNKKNQIQEYTALAQDFANFYRIFISKASNTKNKLTALETVKKVIFTWRFRQRFSMALQYREKIPRAKIDRVLHLAVKQFNLVPPGKKKAYQIFCLERCFAGDHRAAETQCLSLLQQRSVKKILLAAQLSSMLMLNSQKIRIWLLYRLQHPNAMVSLTCAKTLLSINPKAFSRTILDVLACRQDWASNYVATLLFAPTDFLPRKNTKATLNHTRCIIADIERIFYSTLFTVGKKTTGIPAKWIYLFYGFSMPGNTDAVSRLLRQIVLLYPDYQPAKIAALEVLASMPVLLPESFIMALLDHTIAEYRFQALQMGLKHPGLFREKVIQSALYDSDHWIVAAVKHLTIKTPASKRPASIKSKRAISHARYNKLYCLSIKDCKSNKQQKAAGNLEACEGNLFLRSCLQPVWFKNREVFSDI